MIFFFKKKILYKQKHRSSTAEAVDLFIQELESFETSLRKHELQSKWSRVQLEQTKTSIQSKGTFAF